MHEKHIFLLVKRAYPDGNKKARTHSASISQPLPSNITVGYVFKRQTGGVGTFCCQNPPQKEDFTQGQRSTPNPASASQMLSNNIENFDAFKYNAPGEAHFVAKKTHKKPALLNRNTGRCSLKNLDRKKCLPPLLRCCGGWILKSILCRYGYVTMLDRAS
jgi:hypothetical protein